MLKPNDIEQCLKIAIGLVPTPVAPRFKNKPISLANYDVSFVNNVVRSINDGSGLSDKQRELSTKLVAKYVRQFKKLGVDVTLIIDNPAFSSPLRQVDRTRIVNIADDIIYVKFPYNKEMISSFKALINKHLKTILSGWNKEDRQYQVDYNEFNLIKIYNWTKNYRFKYSNEVSKLMNQFEDMIANRSSHAIQLIVDENGCEIKNAPESLALWWNDNVASKDNISQVVSAADQNIDVVNRDKNFVLSNFANRILANRGGVFNFNECTILELVKSAQELGFKDIAYIVDGRTIQPEQVEQFHEVIEHVGFDKTVCLVKHLNIQVLANRRFTSDTNFAILDSIQRFSHNKNRHDWLPDFVIHTNSLTKIKSNEYAENKVPWLCLYSAGI